MHDGKSERRVACLRLPRKLPAHASHCAHFIFSVKVVRHTAAFEAVENFQERRSHPSNTAKGGAASPVERI